MRREHRRVRGATLTEFSLVAGLLFLLVFVVIDLGKYLYVRSTLEAAAREGARRAVVLDAPTASQLEAAIRQHSSDVSFAQPCGPYAIPAPPGTANSGYIYLSAPPGGGNDLTVPAGCGSPPTVPPTAGGHVAYTVTIVYTYKPITPLVSLLTGPITVTYQATMVTEY